jgi:outer membrane receptor protein involved in Fe transport
MELELQAVPAAGLNVNFGLGYTNAEYTKVVANSPLRKGQRVFQTPQWTLSAGADYTRPLTAGLNLVSGINYSYVGDSTSANNDPTSPRIRPDYNLVDARIGVEWKEYTVVIFARNLTDEHADFADNRSIAAELPGRPRVVTNQPRSIGLEIRGNF